MLKLAQPCYYCFSNSMAVMSGCPCTSVCTCSWSWCMMPPQQNRMEDGCKYVNLKKKGLLNTCQLKRIIKSVVNGGLQPLLQNKPNKTCLRYLYSTFSMPIFNPVSSASCETGLIMFLVVFFHPPSVLAGERAPD